MCVCMCVYMLVARLVWTAVISKSCYGDWRGRGMHVGTPTGLTVGSTLGAMVRGIPSWRAASRGPQPGAGAPLSRFQTQGARAGLRGSGVGGGQAEREGRRRAGQKVCGPGGDSGPGMRAGRSAPAARPVLLALLALLAMGKSRPGAAHRRVPASSSVRAPSALAGTPAGDRPLGGESRCPGPRWGLGRDLGALPFMLLSAQEK